MKLRLQRSQRGQSMVIVALLLVALVGMLALALDGGNAYLQRRASQNAADSGALAGARELCVTGDANMAITRAQEYGGRNGIINTGTDMDVTVANGLVTVNTRIPFPTWFGGVLGQPEMTAAAVAEAGCFAPGTGEGVLPVAWSCRPPFGEPGSNTCDIEYDKTYIVMDSSGVTADHCPPEGTLDCDYDNDGTNDVMLGGDRSWVDLNGGGGGASELVNWVTNGYAPEVAIHTWLPLQDGNTTPIYDAAQAREGQTVLLPVFNMSCQGNPLEEPGCTVHTDPADVIIGCDPNCPASAWFFHLITFSGFVIECVSPVPSDHCPAKDLAVADGIFPGNQIKTIEGHFVEGYVPGLGGGGGTYAGLYTIFLTR